MQAPEPIVLQLEHTRAEQTTVGKVWYQPGLGSNTHHPSRTAVAAVAILAILAIGWPSRIITTSDPWKGTQIKEMEGNPEKAKFGNMQEKVKRSFDWVWVAPHSDPPFFHFHMSDVHMHEFPEIDGDLGWGEARASWSNEHRYQRQKQTKCRTSQVGQIDWTDGWVRESKEKLFDHVGGIEVYGNGMEVNGTGLSNIT